MTKLSRGLIAATLVAVIAAGWWFALPPSLTAPARTDKAFGNAPNTTPQGVTVRAADTRQLPSLSSLSKGAVGAPAQATLGRNLEELVNSSGTLADAYRLLENTGSVDAMYFAANIVAHCTGYRPQIAEQLEKRIASDPDSPVRTLRLMELKKRIASCGEIAHADPDAAMAAATKAGSAKAIAYALGYKTPDTRTENEAMTRQAEALAALNDPYVVSELAGFFSVRDRAMVWRLPGVDGDIEGNELYGAMRLVACDLGKDCGATSVDSVGSCIVRGGSFCNTDLETRIRETEYSPAAFARVQQIRQVLTQAARNGRLPGELWQGVVRGAGMRRPSQ